ncbi:MAG: hypothetical protein EXR27_01215 [Betaproteobacteria bacterium]|nr:hypothetical protein [Betaproteobacteria bacterium]
MKVEGTFDIAATREDVFRYITDPRLMAECVPGCEEIEQLSPTQYRTRVVIGVGTIKARFNLTVEITQQNPPESVLSQTRGEEGSRASLISADNEVRLESIAPDTTRVHYSSQVSVTGRLGKFALGIMKKKVESLGKEFAARFSERIRSGLGQ